MVYLQYIDCHSKNNAKSLEHYYILPIHTYAVFKTVPLFDYSNIVNSM